MVEAGAALLGIGGLVLAGPLIIGVGTVGPVAGGIFATLQAAGWVGAGTIAAGVQSAVMTGAVTTAGAAIMGTGAAVIASEFPQKDSDSGKSK